MSVTHIGWALEQRTGAMSRKLVLVALANRINPDTGTCWPSIRRIMAETELGRATVFRALDDLEQKGFIERVERQRENGSQTSSEYRFPSLTVRRGGSQNETGGGITVRPPEPEVRNGSRSTSLPPRRSKQDLNAIWDTFTDIFGPVTTSNGDTLRGRLVQELAAAGATPEQMIARAKAWPKHFDSATLTAPALVKHWDTLGRKPLRRQ